MLKNNLLFTKYTNFTGLFEYEYMEVVQGYMNLNIWRQILLTEINKYSNENEYI